MGIWIVMNDSMTVRDDYVQVAGANIQLLSGGTGPPLVYLHSTEGNLGWQRWMETVSRHRTIYAPTHPGFGSSDRPEWLESVADLARFYLWMIQEMGLAKVCLVGHFLGGWIAAEMAVMSPGSLESLVLVDAAGVRPRDSEIADVFLLGEDEAARLAFHDPAGVADYSELVEREAASHAQEHRIRNREMTTRLCWKPYMYDRSLIWLLPRVDVPTLIIWGAEDRIVPVDSGRRIYEAIAGSRMELVPECGHMPQLEKTDQFTNLLLGHLNGV